MTTKFTPHVHPETYVASDPLEVRAIQLHTKRAHCSLAMCTYADHYDDAKVEYVEAATALRKEIAAAKRAEAKANAEPKPARSKAEEAAIPAVAVEAAAPKAPKAKKERKNETTHPDGASAVATLACPTCSSRKAVRCLRHDGEHTNHVHSARMKAWEAKGSPVATLPAPKKVAAKKVAKATKAGAK